MLTVGELVERLQKYPQHLPIVIATNEIGGSDGAEVVLIRAISGAFYREGDSAMGLAYDVNRATALALWTIKPGRNPQPTLYTPIDTGYEAEWNNIKEPVYKCPNCEGHFWASNLEGHIYHGKQVECPIDAGG